MSLPLSFSAVVAGLFIQSAFSMESRPLKVEQFEFLAPANVKTFNVEGTATQVEGKAFQEGRKITGVELKVPVEKLSTGMKVRDQHMKERIFTAADGSVPPIVFKASGIDCDLAAQGRCKVPGVLSIRGTERPQSLEIEHGGNSFKGTTAVKLSDFGIPAPSQLGVKVQDQVSLTFQGKVD